MLGRVKKLLDIRPGETLPLLLTFFYIAVVIASFLLAKPIRNGLFLNRYGAYKLVYVYVGVPLVLSLFVPLYARIASRWGQRVVITGTLLFFCTNVLAFWYFFRFHQVPVLSAAFYIWVNCYAVIAPVQVWTFANRLFDTRQAKRLFGLIGAGASLGAITGGLLARLLVGPMGGAVNLLLVLAALIALAAGIVNIAWTYLPARPQGRGELRARVPFLESLRLIGQTPYLRLIAAAVFLVAIVTQWTQFQFSLVAEQRFAGDADRLTRFFGEFNFYLGLVAFTVQLLVTGPALRRFGIGLTILLLPLALGVGSTLILLSSALWSVMLTNGLDQGLRFSIDKATYELLYLPIPGSLKSNVKVTVDTIVNRLADGVGGLLLGVATQGFNLVFLALPGAGFSLRGIAAVNLVFVAVWIGVALALRHGYVDAIRDSIHRHRLDAERAAAAGLDRSATELLTAKLAATEPGEILYALDVLALQSRSGAQPALRSLVAHGDPAVRHRAVAMLREADDLSVLSQVEQLLHDPALEVRTEALLYLAHHTRLDPVSRLQELGDFPDFSIRAGIVAYLAYAGKTQNLDAARVLLDGMVSEGGRAGRRSRLEAAKLIAALPDEFGDALLTLLRDEDPEVTRSAIRAAGRLGRRDAIRPLIGLLGHPEHSGEAADALVRLGDPIVGTLRDHLIDDRVPIESRREIPGVLARVATPAAQRVLVESLLQSDAALRFRIIASLNKLRQLNPDLTLDSALVETVLAAEIMGHYRSYQVLGRLHETLDPDDPVVLALKQSMEHEMERIFRLMGLLFPSYDLHSAYVGLQSTKATVRANALEFLDNVLKPQLRALVVPLFDAQVGTAERVHLANRLVGASVDTRDAAILALLASDDPWLRSRAAYTIGALRLVTLEPTLDRWLDDPDASVRETARAAKERLALGVAEPAEIVAPETQSWEQADTLGVG